MTLNLLLLCLYSEQASIHEYINIDSIIFAILNHLELVELTSFKKHKQVAGTIVEYRKHAFNISLKTRFLNTIAAGAAPVSIYIYIYIYMRESELGPLKFPQVPFLIRAEPLSMKFG